MIRGWVCWQQRLLGRISGGVLNSPQEMLRQNALLALALQRYERLLYSGLQQIRLV